MSKIIKIFLNQGFCPINQKAFKLGTTIDFNCYIKRFNGFVILIERGTLLDEKIYKKITNPTLQIYVENCNYQQYKEYRIQHNTTDNDFVEQAKDLNFDEECKNCSDIKNILSTQATTPLKLKILYKSSSNLLNAWIVAREEKMLPLEALGVLVENLVEIVNQENITLSHFNDFLDAKYSLATHMVKVTFFTSIVANAAKLNLNDQRHVALAAMIHDVGTCNVDESLLGKVESLTKNESKVIKEHPEASVKLAKRSGMKDRKILSAIREHHERLDGSGYPRSLFGKRIGQFGRLLAVCDIFDELITEKPYRGAYNTFNASALLRDEYKNKLDNDYIQLLIKNLK